MSYATVQDFITAYTLTEAIMLTNLDRPSATTVDEDVLNRALEDASHKIDSYIGIYKGMSNPPEYIITQLRRCCCAYARELLSIHGNDEVVFRACDDCDRWLRDVRDGKLSLVLDADNTQTGGDVYVTYRDANIFEFEMRGY